MLSIISIIISASTALHPGKVPVPDTFAQPPPPSAVIRPREAPQLALQAELVIYTPPHPNVADTAGNAYPSDPYQCTRYVKDRRPDIPNHLGNADLWFTELKALGWPTGLVPRAGAIGASILGMHVVYVESVNADGSIHLSERNWDYHGSFRVRDAAANLFHYIY